MKIGSYTTDETQDKILKKLLKLIAWKDENLEDIVNIVYSNRNKSIDEVTILLYEKNYTYIDNDEIDIITLWMKTRTNILFKKNVLY